MSTHDLRDKLDGLTHGGRMDSVYPESMSLLHRGLGSPTAIIDKSQHHQAYKRKVKKNMDRNKSRFRTQPVTFMEIKEVDEDTPDLSNSLAVNAAPASGISDSNANPTSSGSTLDIMSIAEAHREKSKSQQDLKRQFEEFSRNLCFRHSPGGNNAAVSPRNKNIPEIALNNRTCQENELISPSELEEDEDRLGRLTPVGGVSGTNNQLLVSQGDIDFPEGFRFRARPSI